VRLRETARKFIKGVFVFVSSPLRLTVRVLRWKNLYWKIPVIVAIALGVHVSRYFFYPDVSKLAKENPRLTELMVFMERRPEKRGDDLSIEQDWVPLQRVSPYLVKAVLIAEDDKFWSHEGFDVDAIKEAIGKDIKAKRFKYGGSTITQQLAKNLYLSPSKNPVRKIEEAIITWRMERALSKGRILEIYLNVIEWGESIYGIEAASRNYYGKKAHELGPREAARLAASLPNPKKYLPTGSSRYIKNRSEIIYKEMVRRGIVSPEKQSS
jgi:monofunctional biosynthetic peptidoglycan transglycosylase